MKLELENKSEKTRSRVEIIQADIKCYRESIELLHAYAEGRMIAQGFNYAPRIVKYSYLPHCQKRYLSTVKNLQDQVALLERELDVLIEYGA
jgi:hypothetical protein